MHSSKPPYIVIVYHIEAHEFGVIVWSFNKKIIQSTLCWN
jgi:hypothetical protein